MFIPPFLPGLFISPRRQFSHAPIFAAAGGEPTTRFFRNPPARPPWREDPPPPPDDNRRFEPHNPLSEREQRTYLILTAIGCLPFLLLILLAIITHSPLMAN